MRTYPVPLDVDSLTLHKSEVEADYDNGRALRHQPEHAHRPEYFGMSAEQATELAALAYCFEESDQRVNALLSEAASNWAEMPRLSTPLDPLQYIRAISAAITAGDVEIRVTLANYERSQYTNPNVDADELFYLLADQLAAFATEDREHAERLAPRIETRAGSNDVPAASLRVLESLRQLLTSVVDQDQARLNKSIERRIAYYRAGQKGEPYNPEWLLDAEGLAVLRLARETGLHPVTTSVYLPLSLIEG